MRPFPKLMCHKNAPDRMVVFFNGPNTGMVLHSEVEGEPVGKYADDWNPEYFEDVSDDVIIWLTEGDKAPVYEAIEMVEKVRALHPVETEAS